MEEVLRGPNHNPPPSHKFPPVGPSSRPKMKSSARTLFLVQIGLDGSIAKDGREGEGLEGVEWARDQQWQVKLPFPIDFCLLMPPRWRRICRSKVEILYCRQFRHLWGSGKRPKWKIAN